METKHVKKNSRLVVHAPLNFNVHICIKMKQGESKSVKVSPDLLRCVANDFNRIVVRLKFVFYTLVSFQVLFSTLSALMHANEKSGLLGDENTVILEGLIYAITSELIAGIIIVIPISTSLDNCKKSYILAVEYAVSREAVPRKMLIQMYEANTLCFTHPFARSECRQLYVEATRENTSPSIQNKNLIPT